MFWWEDYRRCREDREVVRDGRHIVLAFEAFSIVRENDAEINAEDGEISRG